MSIEPEVQYLQDALISVHNDVSNVGNVFLPLVLFLLDWFHSRGSETTQSD